MRRIAMIGFGSGVAVPCAVAAIDRQCIAEGVTRRWFRAIGLLARPAMSRPPAMQSTTGLPRHGSAGSHELASNQAAPVAGIGGTPDGAGYWLPLTSGHVSGFNGATDYTQIAGERWGRVRLNRRDGLTVSSAAGLQPSGFFRRASGLGPNAISTIPASYAISIFG